MSVRAKEDEMPEIEVEDPLATILRDYAALDCLYVDAQCARTGSAP